MVEKKLLVPLVPYAAKISDSPLRAERARRVKRAPESSEASDNLRSQVPSLYRIESGLNAEVVEIMFCGS